MRPIYLLSRHTQASDAAMLFAQEVASAMSFNLSPLDFSTLRPEAPEALNQRVESEDVALLVIDLQQSNEIKLYLSVCRELRIPYVFVRPQHRVAFSRIGVPVTYLIEEKEKGPFAAAFARHMSSSLILYCPKDYGSKARKNIEAMQNLFHTMQLEAEERQTPKNSDKVEKYVTKQAKREHLDLVFVMASREYGLDDLFLGPKELHILQLASCPILLLNPRGDLYALCD